MTDFQYGDKICRRMGLGPLCDPAWKQDGLRGLRAVFCPSFHPKGVITLTDMAGEPQCHVRFETQLHPWSSDVSVETREESFPWSADLVALLLRHWTLAIEAEKMAGDLRLITLDGMGVYAVYCDSGLNTNLSGHCMDPIFNAVPILLLDAARRIASDAFIQNRLADCINYLGVPVARVPEPGKPNGPALANLLVLGGEEDRAQLARAIQAQQAIKTVKKQQVNRTRKRDRT